MTPDMVTIGNIFIHSYIHTFILHTERIVLSERIMAFDIGLAEVGAIVLITVAIAKGTFFSLNSAER